MNKKGFQLTLDFVIDLIIGILCALIIIYLGTLLYGMFFSGKDKEMAQQSLISIENTAKNLQLEESKDLLLEVPRGRYLASFEKGVNSENKDVLPQTFCADSDCLCVCKPIKFLGLVEQSVDCRKNGECKIFNKPFKENEKDLYIKIQGNFIKITNYETFFDVKRE